MSHGLGGPALKRIAIPDLTDMRLRPLLLRREPERTGLREGARTLERRRDTASRRQKSPVHLVRPIYPEVIRGNSSTTGVSSHRRLDHIVRTRASLREELRNYVAAAMSQERRRRRPHDWGLVHRRRKLESRQWETPQNLSMSATLPTQTRRGCIR